MGGKPVPAMVMVDPTIAALGETVIVGEPLAAFAEPAKRRIQSRAEVAAMEKPGIVSFDGGRFRRFIARFGRTCG